MDRLGVAGGGEERGARAERQRVDLYTSVMQENSAWSVAVHTYTTGQVLTSVTQENGTVISLRSASFGCTKIFLKANF